MDDLFAALPASRQGGASPVQDPHSIAPGAILFPRRICTPHDLRDPDDSGTPADTTWDSLLISLTETSPWRHMMTPGGRTMSVEMINCGPQGWVTDRRGYRYQPTDPLTDKPWPMMPVAWHDTARKLAAEAGYEDFDPDACLINRYGPGARMAAHQDRDEADMTQPIVSISLGMDAVFLFGGLTRKDPLQRIPLHHGDVVVWGGPSRLVFHGIAPVKDHPHPDLGACRINLTFRRALPLSR